MPKPHILTGIEIARLKQMHSDGLYQDQIWPALGITKRRYLEYRKILGLPPRKQGSGGGSKHPCWKGGRRKQGAYWMLWMPGHPHATGGRQSYVYEHRIVMERHLGRILESHEIVHHRNGDGSDNRLENLELTDQSSHMSEHSRERWQKTPKEERMAKLTELWKGYAKHGLHIGGDARVKQRELNRQRKSIPKYPPEAS